ncbi:carbohydrate kinase family protein [Telmatospirillum siberiense]|uniref:Carbohydrate kinase family protein n=1 Tax=Telmatospirillum siberiense TaxID=382514 RepID=A0A2N3PRY7_9PROT|nr:carbohydrate kinase family protein [Telmatospirillum siberiense]PKU23170.1 carbohydrate kinase family protein [Telmatospirillum siberiense]
MKMLTLGGAMIDTVAIIGSDRIERMSMYNADSSFLLLEEGHKTEAQDISTHCGGGAINAAVAMARLGLDVAALVKVGCDARAEILLERLRSEGVSTRWVRQDGRAPTGASVLVSSHDRNAAIFTFRGVNTLLEPGDLDDNAFAVDAVYVTTLSNKSAECFPTIVRKAKAHGALVATNPGLRQLSAHGAAFQDSLKFIDIIALNRTEAGALVPALVSRVDSKIPAPALVDDDGRPLAAAKSLTGGGYDMDIPEFFRILGGLGPDYVVLTDGSRGAFVGLPDRILFCPAAECLVVGTAGAGDSFSATFTAYVALGYSAEDALRAATINAASVVGHVDTQSGLLPFKEIEAALADETRSPRVHAWPLKR